ncbi:MAG: FtsX-like permease family protein, partial [Sphingobacteriales bacterium]|nr:FtsX-like permease family protein [Sphingobacteriales bacterium]
IGQFLGESILISFIAGVLALIIITISLPYFADLVQKKLSINFSDYRFWLAGFGIILFTGLLAGSYPALYLSGFKPVAVLKGTFKKVNALVTPRKVLVVTQFAFAIILIIGAIIVRQQLLNAQDRQTGYSKDNLVYSFLEGDIEKNYSLIKNELLSSGIATSVTKTSAPITEGWSNSWGIEWQGKNPHDKTVIDRYCADDDICKTAGLQIVQGRDIDLDKYPTDSLAMLLNESAVKHMKFTEPLGQIIKDNDKDWHVVGVVKDFILKSPYRPIEPMIIEGAAGWFNVIQIKMNTIKSTRKNLAAAEAIFKKYNPNYPFEYKFVDEQYAKKFDNEKRTGKLAGLFAFLTIFISCLGLFGLASYMAETRIKEIGVRKVLGASVFSITRMLSKDFLTLVIIAFAVGAPLAFWGMYKWLQDYPYHITIEWWVFALAGFTAILIALLTVSYQAIKAAVANPVKSLRTE